jgi:circadian clock protein KaiB
MNDEPLDSTGKFEKALADEKNAKYVLRLYVAGNTPRSVQAIENIRSLCETTLQDRYSLEVIDIYQQPEIAREDQILAAPTLIKLLPLPLRRMIGDLSTRDRVLVGLNLEPIERSLKDQPEEPGETQENIP